MGSIIANGYRLTRRQWSTGISAQCYYGGRLEGTFFVSNDSPATPVLSKAYWLSQSGRTGRYRALETFRVYLEDREKQTIKIKSSDGTEGHCSAEFISLMALLLRTDPESNYSVKTGSHAFTLNAGQMMIRQHELHVSERIRARDVLFHKMAKVATEHRALCALMEHWS